MCSLTKVLNLVPDSALFPAPSLGFVTVVTSSACLFVIMWAASLSLLLPIQNAAAHDIHYLFQLQYIQEKVAENISQPTFFFFFFPSFPRLPHLPVLSQALASARLLALRFQVSSSMPSLKFPLALGRKTPQTALKLLCYD